MSCFTVKSSITSGHRQDSVRLNHFLREEISYHGGGGGGMVFLPKLTIFFSFKQKNIIFLPDRKKKNPGMSQTNLFFQAMFNHINW